MTFARSCIFAALLALVLPAHGGDFKYQAPPGWKVLVEQGKRTSEGTLAVPVTALRDSFSGRYAFVAVDPMSTDREKLGATVNAVEMKTTGHLTHELATQAATGIVDQLWKVRVPANVVSAEIGRLNGVDVAVLTLDLTGQDGQRRMRQYIVPGKNGATAITYQAPREDFDKHVPEFETSARATHGMYDPGVFHWNEFFLSGLIGGVVAGVAGGVIAFVRKRRNAAEGVTEDAQVAVASAPAAKPPARKPSKHVWYCDDCGKPVPIRIEECRCGGKKPA